MRLIACDCLQCLSRVAHLFTPLPLKLASSHPSPSKLASLGIRIGSSDDVRRWLPAAMLHSGAYLLLLEALHRTSVTNVIVWRQLMPIFTMVVEQVRGM